jgi:hypothetical protein
VVDFFQRRNADGDDQKWRLNVAAIIWAKEPEAGELLK